MFGVVSESVSSICGGFLYNKEGIITSMFTLTVLSFLVWGHHMMVVNMLQEVKLFFMIVTVIISIPTGVKVFSWVYSMVLFGNRINIISILINIFIFNFTIGGITGVFLANYSLDIVFHDSYFVVGHFHTILSSASLFGLLSGSHLILNMVSIKKTMFDCLLFVIGMLLVGITNVLISFYSKGVLGVPRRVSNYVLEYYFYFYVGSLGLLGV